MFSIDPFCIKRSYYANEFEVERKKHSATLSSLRGRQCMHFGVPSVKLGGRIVAEAGVVLVNCWCGPAFFCKPGVGRQGKASRGRVSLTFHYSVVATSDIAHFIDITWL